MEDTDVLTAKEAAAYLRIDTLKLYRLARQGKIPAVKIGRRGWRFSHAQLERYVRGQIDTQR